MLQAKDIDDEADRLDDEAQEIEEQISSADLWDSQIIAAREAMVKPREKAADLLRQASRAIRAIPPLGLVARARPE